MWEMGCPYHPPWMKFFKVTPSWQWGTNFWTVICVCKISNSWEKNNCNDNKKRTKGLQSIKDWDIDLSDYAMSTFCLYWLMNSRNQFVYLAKQDTPSGKEHVSIFFRLYVLIAGPLYNVQPHIINYSFRMLYFWSNQQENKKTVKSPLWGKVRFA